MLWKLIRGRIRCYRMLLRAVLYQQGKGWKKVVLSKFHVVEASVSVKFHLFNAFFWKGFILLHSGIAFTLAHLRLCIGRHGALTALVLICITGCLMFDPRESSKNA